MKLLPLVALATLSAAIVAQAQDSTLLPEVKVLAGDREQVSNPAAPTRISSETFDEAATTDIHRMLRQAPGVHIREEDGFGLRPNIGLRGTNPERSKKVVFLEDGILAGPSPYTSPAAYYAPTLLTASSLEIYKGFAAVPFGPNSIGGAINYLSDPIPTEPLAELEASYGSFNSMNLGVKAGNSTSWGGYHIKLARVSTDGFKELDTGGDTGFFRNEVLAKARVNLGASEDRAHFVEIRLGYGEEDSDETYLGITQADFDDNPHRRYAASELDNMTWDRSRVHLTHAYQITDTSVVTTDLYYLQFTRDWYKFNGFRNSPNSNRNMLLYPEAGDEAFLDVLRGDADSVSVHASDADIQLRGANRTHKSQGIHTRYENAWDTTRVRYELEAGLRYHVDSLDNESRSGYYQMEDGRLKSLGPDDVTGESYSDAKAGMLHARLNALYDDWVITALMRAEQVDFTAEDDTRSDNAFVPGIGVLRKITPEFSVRASVNQAVTLAGLSMDDTEAKEESMNYELGLSYQPENGQTRVEATAFFNDYDKLLGTCMVATGCDPDDVGKQFQGGSADVMGLEGRVGRGFQIGRVWLPVYLNLTLIDAKFTEDFNATSPDWGDEGELVEEGSPLPYIPKVQYSLNIGAEYGNFKQNLVYTHQGEVYDKSASNNRLSIPAYGVIDWSASYGLSQAATVLFKVENLLDTDYEVSYRPFGLRSGKARTFMLGASYRF